MDTSTMVPHNGDIIYARFANDPPTTASRPGFVLLTRQLNLTAEFDAPLWCQPGAVAELQFVENQVRWLTEGTVQSSVCGVPHPMIRFKLEHEPIQAERRHCVRISTAAAHLQAVVSERPGCDILNVSAEGLAVTTNDAHEVNAFIPVTMASGGETFRGGARVTHAERRPDGRWRCGLHVEPDQRSLLQGLQRMVTAVQRQQLHRMGAWR